MPKLGRGRVSFRVSNSPSEHAAMRNAELELVDASSGAAGDSRSSFDAVVGQHNHKRKKSAIAMLALEELARTKERRWSVAVSSLVTSITSMLMGATMSLSSSAALDLTGEAKELSQDYLFSTLHLSLFAVGLRLYYIIISNIFSSIMHESY